MSQPPAPAKPDLADFLRLEDLGERRYRAHNFQDNHHDAVFGGCLLAQALHAAELTAPGRAPHSLHGHFHRPGNSTRPLDYEVDLLRDGASFSSRRVSAAQNGKLVFDATISFHLPEPGFERAQRWAETPPAPETLHSPQDLAELWRDRIPDDEFERMLGFEGLDARLINPEDLLLRHSEPTSRIWVRPTRTGDAPVSPYCALAFVSDFMMPGAAYMPFTRSTYDTGIASMSLDHAVWFHAPLPAGDWMLHEMDSPWAGSGRGLSFGRMYARDGSLLASTAQEILIRKVAGR